MSSRFRNGHNGRNGPPSFLDDDPGYDASLFEEAEREVGARSGTRANAVASPASRTQQRSPAAPGTWGTRPEYSPSPASRPRSTGSAWRSSGTAPDSVTRGSYRSTGMTGTVRNPGNPVPLSIADAAAGGRLPAFEGTGAGYGTRETLAQGDAEPQKEKPLTVTEALGRLRDALYGILERVWLEGEVAQVKVSSYGHVYFSLKDERSVIDCVLFRGNRGSGRLFAVGEKIEVNGRADIYAERGRLQMIVQRWRPAGQGSLYEAFLKLKARLEVEGLFDPARKRPIPKFVRRVALVTSSQAAAFGDVVRTIERRTPWVRILHAEAPVQGSDAPGRLISALRLADEARCDVVLLVRGGGAYEDLQAFNDEALARAICAMKTPVISGVGHETDVTIADFAADLRASTPTAAAESIGHDIEHWKKRIGEAAASLERAVDRGLEHGMLRLDTAEDHLPDPMNLLAGLSRMVEQRAARFLPASDLLVGREARLTVAVGLLADPQRVLFFPEDRVRRAAAFLADPARALAGPGERLRRAERLLADPQQMLARAQARTDRAANFLADPGAVLESADRRFGRLSAQLMTFAETAEERRAQRLGWPEERLESAVRTAFANAARELTRAAARRPDPLPRLGVLEARLRAQESALALADPNRPLRAGYARIRTAGGLATRAGMLRLGQSVEIVFADGSAAADVREVKRTPDGVDPAKP